MFTNTTALRVISRLAIPLLTIACCAANTARAQCTYSWPAGSFGGGLNAAASSAAVDTNGDLVVGGRFTAAGGSAAAHIARWNGASWGALGSGMDGDVLAICTLANGDLVAGGSFTTAGGVVANGLARWDGTSWTAFGTGLDAFPPFGPAVLAIEELPNGDLVIGGLFDGVNGIAVANVARYDGSWHAMASGLDGVVRDVAVTPAGDVVAVGGFVTSGGATVNRVASWNGTSWSPLGSGVGIYTASAVAVDASGAIYVGGLFGTAGGVAASNVARFASGAWSALGTGTNAGVTSLSVLPSGDLVVGGAFTEAGGSPNNRVARWSGGAWSPAFGVGAADEVYETVGIANGDVVVVGRLTAAGGSGQGYVARLASSCASQVTSLGPGCSGSGGLNELVIAAHPLIGSTMRAKGTGMPPFAFVLAVTGFANTSLPLVTVLPQALPGCSLYANPDVIDVLLPSAGMVQSSLAVPLNATLVGAPLALQYVPLEVDPSLSITAVTASNGVEVTVGTF